MTVLWLACPIAYHYRPEDLAGPPAFTCTTLYVAGGIYGNPYALDAIQARASAEPTPPEIVFNGDFHYLDTDPAVFRPSTTACAPTTPPRATSSTRSPPPMTP